MKNLILAASLLAATACVVVEASAQRAPTDGQQQDTAKAGKKGGSGQSKGTAPASQPSQPQTKPAPVTQSQPQPSQRSAPPQQPAQRAASPSGQRSGQPQRAESGGRWEGGHGSPPRGAWQHSRPHGWCIEKARRLHDFERSAASDGRVSRGEQRIISQLRADLRESCGGGRWAPDRGWYY